MRIGAGAETHQALEHLFRRESGKLVAVITRMLGPSNIEASEDIVQETVLRALREWSEKPLPDNPASWMMRCAKNLALDHIRRQRFLQWVEPSVAYHLTDIQQPLSSPDDVVLDGEIADDQLRMMFTCCHPSLNKEAQIALTLKTLCGFSTSEIARMFFLAEPTIAKRLVRARQTIREAAITFEVPIGDELEGRLNAVLNVLYLLFNQGYSATGDDEIRRELCEEAMYLTAQLLSHPVCNLPKTNALLALMHLHLARFDSRIDGEGNLLLVSEQNRASWDAAMIARGLDYLRTSAAGEVITEYHIEAGILACHVTAADFTSTNWPQILGLYDLLVLINDSPIVALNRCVALARVEGPNAALAALDAIAQDGMLRDYYLVHAIRGDLHIQRGDPSQALAEFEQALAHAPSPKEQRLLQAKMASCQE